MALNLPSELVGDGGINEPRAETEATRLACSPGTRFAPVQHERVAVLNMPVDVHRAARVRKRAIFRGVGCEFVECHCQRLRRLRRDPYVRALESELCHVTVCRGDKGRHFLLNEMAQGCALWSNRRKQRLRASESRDACFDGTRQRLCIGGPRCAEAKRGLRITARVFLERCSTSRIISSRRASVFARFRDVLDDDHQARRGSRKLRHHYASGDTAAVNMDDFRIDGIGNATHSRGVNSVLIALGKLRIYE